MNLWRPEGAILQEVTRERAISRGSFLSPPEMDSLLEG